MYHVCFPAKTPSVGWGSQGSLKWDPINVDVTSQWGFNNEKANFGKSFEHIFETIPSRNYIFFWRRRFLVGVSNLTDKMFFNLHVIWYGFVVKLCFFLKKVPLWTKTLCTEKRPPERSVQYAEASCWSKNINSLCMHLHLYTCISLWRNKFILVFVHGWKMLFVSF